MDLILHLVKLFSISFFFFWRVQIDLSRDLLWFGVSLRGVLVKTTNGGGVEIGFMINRDTSKVLFSIRGNDCKPHLQYLL